MPDIEKLHEISTSLQLCKLNAVDSDVLAYLLIKSPATMKEIVMCTNRDEPAVSLSLKRLLQLELIKVKQRAIKKTVMGRCANLYSSNSRVLDKIGLWNTNEHNYKIQKIELIKEIISKGNVEKETERQDM
ncbi:MAG: helix-turn-helix domain-containing protein [Proteobacteria bacterium]|nr:helix-turn-helix domain-containing protein [Pseudomonadota bacterium]